MRLETGGWRKLQFFSLPTQSSRQMPRPIKDFITYAYDSSQGRMPEPLALGKIRLSFTPASRLRSPA